MPEPDRDRDRDALEGERRPTADQPLNAPKRPLWVPLLLLAGFIAVVLVVIFLTATLAGSG